MVFKKSEKETVKDPARAKELARREARETSESVVPPAPVLKAGS
jgi:hypothetical protein